MNRTNRTNTDLTVFLAKKIFERLYSVLVDMYESKYHIFLVGGSIHDQKMLRAHAYLELKRSRLIELHFPEEWFNNLINTRTHDMLSMENVLAESVHSVVMCVESPGSFAELGAFANHEKLNTKLIVYMDKKHEHSDSFLRHGPVKFLKKTTSAVFWYNYDLKFHGETIRVMREVRRIKEKTDVVYGLSNLIFADKFLLALVYLLKEIKFSELKECVKQIEMSSGKTEEELQESVEIINYLLHTSNYAVDPLDDGTRSYSLSDQGYESLSKAFGNGFIYKVLDKIRLEVLNLQLRKNWV